MHEVLVNRLGGLSLPRKSVVRLTDRPDMTLDVYHGRKKNNATTMQQCNNKNDIIKRYLHSFIGHYNYGSSVRQKGLFVLVPATYKPLSPQAGHCNHVSDKFKCAIFLRFCGWISSTSKISDDANHHEKERKKKRKT